MGGASRCTGEIQMKHQSEWRPVDPYEWSHQSSSVVCRQLGCGSAVSTEERDGSTEQPVWEMKSPCVGSEPSLRECGAVESSRSSYSLYLICSGNNNDFNNDTDPLVPKH